ncbi:haloacid dehalogenase type II [Marinospirillum perlucidum]|uniref:haloacid dehalogenase type II n=1 Tax=Marinospirillum perlucidum TaxID=1982602 RepID=UPI000DF431C9|nr:haloacid dehalogenase type II [Marinospirillum perlucidum]
MQTTLAFDVYGTLIDTQGVLVELQKLLGDQAPAFSARWREKQLEYSFRRGLMQNYQDFSVCTRDALEFCDRFYQTQLTAEQKQQLLACYRTLPAFDDAKAALQELSEAGFRLFAFSNGSAEAVKGLLQHAGIDGFFEGVVSVEDLKSFKPNPAVYSHFLRSSSARANETWLISSNPFDVIGAVSAGWQAAWVQRSSEAVFDPWGIEPDARVTSLGELKRVLDAAR